MPLLALRAADPRSPREPAAPARAAASQPLLARRAPAGLTTYSGGISVHQYLWGRTRRVFLKTAGSLAVGLGLGPRLGRADEPKPPASADVGIARGSNLEEAVRRAVRLAGGMDFIQEGQTV